MKFGILECEEDYILDKVRNITCPESDEIATQIAGFVGYDKVKNISILVEGMKELNETET